MTDRIWIVDWEYAGMGDRYFDLANFAMNHDCRRPSTRAAQDYSARSGPSGWRPAPDADHVGLPRGDVGRPPAGAQHLDVDFVEYAATHFARLLETAARESFDAWLEEAADG